MKWIKTLFRSSLTQHNNNNKKATNLNLWIIWHFQPKIYERNSVVPAVPKGVFFIFSSLFWDSEAQSATIPFQKYAFKYNFDNELHIWMTNGWNHLHWKASLILFRLMKWKIVNLFNKLSIYVRTNDNHFSAVNNFCYNWK